MAAKQKKKRVTKSEQRKAGTQGKSLQKLPLWKEKYFLPALALVAILAFAAMSPALDNEFVDWDDPEYARDQPLIHSTEGKAFDAIVETPVMGNYHPVTMYSLALDYQADPRTGETDPAPFHRTNIILHILNSILVFYFLFVFTGRRLVVSAFVALIFAVHPMHVESVAWISERKDVLYTFFFVLAMIMYWYYMKKKNFLYLGATLVFFFFSCFSKPSAVIFPFVMILMDYFDRRPLINVRTIAEKVPFFGISLWVGLLTLKAQEAAGATEAQAAFSTLEHGFFAFNGVMMYIAKAFVPVKLSGIYPYPKPTEPLPILVYASPAIVTGIAFLIWRFFRNNRGVVFGMAFFLVNLLLVLQFIAVGSAMYADRYTYVPYIGLFFAIAWFFDMHFKKNEKLGPLTANSIMGVGFVAVAIFTGMSFDRCGYWKDSPTFWGDVIEKYPRQAPLAYNNLGKWYRERGQYYKAIEHYREGIKTAPAYYLSYNNMGTAYFYLQKPDSALPYYNKAIELKPDYVDSWFNRGAIKAQLNDKEGALADLTQALTLEPGNITALKNRSLVYLDLQQFDNSIKDANAVLQQQPNNADMVNHIGVCYQRANNHKNAIEWFGKAIAMNPNQPQFLFNRSISYFQSGNRNAALNDAQTAKQMGFKVDDSFMQTLQSSPMPES